MCLIGLIATSIAEVVNEEVLYSNDIKMSIYIDLTFTLTWNSKVKIMKFFVYFALRPACFYGKHSRHDVCLILTNEMTLKGQSRMLNK